MDAASPHRFAPEPPLAPSAPVPVTPPAGRTLTFSTHHDLTAMRPATYHTHSLGSWRSEDRR